MGNMVTEKRRIQTIDLGPTRKRGETLDELALDEPLCVFVNGEYHVTLIATPEMRRELAVGYLLSGGVISSVDDIASIETRGSDIMVEMRSRVDLRGAMVDMMNLIVTACSASPRPRPRFRAAVRRISVRAGPTGRATPMLMPMLMPSTVSPVRTFCRIRLRKMSKTKGMATPPRMHKATVKRPHCRRGSRQQARRVW